MVDHVYVYCAVEGAPGALPVEGMPDGDPPRSLSLQGPFSLIVSAVSSAVYNAESLEPRLADLEWVAAAGAAHHAVVDALAEAGLVVLPFRLFTIFSSEAKAVETFDNARAAMERAFQRVRGRQEWVLRIGQPDPTRVEARQALTTPAASGTGFLRAKADARRENLARAERVKQDAAGSFEALATLADESASRPVDPGGALLCDAAFLIPPSRAEALREALSRSAARLLRDGCPVSLTGPWPPYSFASMGSGTDV